MRAQNRGLAGVCSETGLGRKKQALSRISGPDCGLFGPALETGRPQSPNRVGAGRGPLRQKVVTRVGRIDSLNGHGVQRQSLTGAAMRSKSWEDKPPGA